MPPRGEQHVVADNRVRGALTVECVEALLDSLDLSLVGVYLVLNVQWRKCTIAGRLEFESGQVNAMTL